MKRKGKVMRRKRKAAAIISAILIAVLLCSLTVTAAEADDNAVMTARNTSGLTISGGSSPSSGSNPWNILQSGDQVNITIDVSNNTSEDIYLSGASLKFEATNDPFNLFPETIAQNTIEGMVPADSYLSIPVSAVVPDTTGILDDSKPVDWVKGDFILVASDGNEIGRFPVDFAICRPPLELIVSVESETGEVWEGAENPFTIKVTNPTAVDATDVTVRATLHAASENRGDTVGETIYIGPVDIKAGATEVFPAELYIERGAVDAIQWNGEDFSTSILAHAESQVESNGIAIPVFEGDARYAVEYHEEGENTHTHVWESERIYDETYCWRPCSVAGCTAQEDKLEHNLDLVIDTESTEERDGEGHYECTYGCGYKSESFTIAYTASTKRLEGGYGVTMYIPEYAPDGLELKVTVSDGSEEKEVIGKLMDIEGDRIKTFDLSLLRNGYPYEYNGQFRSTVSLPVPEGWDMDRLAFYYLDEAAGEATSVAFDVDKENRTILFETEHFSRYVLAQKAETTATELTPQGNEQDEGTTTQISEEDNAFGVPQTGDETNLWLYLVLLIAAGVVLVSLYIKKKIR